MNLLDCFLWTFSWCARTARTQTPFYFILKHDFVGANDDGADWQLDCFMAYSPILLSDVNRLMPKWQCEIEKCGVGYAFYASINLHAFGGWLVLDTNRKYHTKR